MSRSNRTEPPRKPTLTLVGDGRDESGRVLSAYGPVRAGLTTSPRTSKEVALTELLSSLELQLADQTYRLSVVCDTLANVMERLVKHYDSILDTATTDVVE